MDLNRFVSPLDVECGGNTESLGPRAKRAMMRTRSSPSCCFPFLPQQIHSSIGPLFCWGMFALSPSLSEGFDPA